VCPVAEPDNSGLKSCGAVSSSLRSCPRSAGSLRRSGAGLGLSVAVLRCCTPQATRSTGTDRGRPKFAVPVISPVCSNGGSTGSETFPRAAAAASRSGPCGVESSAWSAVVAVERRDVFISVSVDMNRCRSSAAKRKDPRHSASCHKDTTTAPRSLWQLIRIVRPLSRTSANTSPRRGNGNISPTCTGCTTTRLTGKAKTRQGVVGSRSLAPCRRTRDRPGGPPGCVGRPPSGRPRGLASHRGVALTDARSSGWPRLVSNQRPRACKAHLAPALPSDTVCRRR
jgi:hypothetical protein